MCRSLRIARRSSGSHGNGKSSVEERGKSEIISEPAVPTATEVITSPTADREETVTVLHTGSPTSAELVANLKPDSSTRARYLLELDQHVGDNLLQEVLELMQRQNLSCDVIKGSDGDRHILVTATFEVLVAQV